MIYKVNERPPIKKVLSDYICAIKKQVDYILVGQGLAGSCLALRLIRNGKKIIVFDEPANNRASAVAPGLFNPIAGKFLKQSWLAEKLFPCLFQFYQDAETLLATRFFYPMPIYRPFLSIEEQNEWMAKSEGGTTKTFISKIHTSCAFADQVHDPVGGIITEYSGYLDTALFMTTTREFLKRSNAYRESHFDFEKLLVQEEEVAYEDIVSAKIIFCEGAAVKKNPYFGWIPVRPLKGETLSISLKESPEVIFNRGVYVVPAQREKLFKAGATYTPEDSTEAITVSAKNELEGKLNELMKTPFTINHQNWGMRPTTPDRKPIIGEHPEHKNLLIFNGLGTKGVSLAPYFSEQISAWLEGHGEIVSQVNIDRFKSLYSRFSSAKI